MANSMSVDQVLSQIRAFRQEVSTQVGAFNEAGKSADKVDFSAMLKQSVDAVNATQQHAGGMAAAFERGDANVNLAEVMVSLQKADVSFKAMVEVRNKLIDAYQEVMRMSV